MRLIGFSAMVARTVRRYALREKKGCVRQHVGAGKGCCAAFFGRVRNGSGRKQAIAQTCLG
jgi:hypothetical protein